jgi:ubiquinone/menaquinone biosynthesis C-methylase UbiE
METFGYKWDKWPDAGQSTDRTGPQNRIERNGWEVSDFEAWVEDKTVLDAGTGAGWWVHYLESVITTGRVVGVDIAFDVVQRGKNSGNGELLNGDIATLPFDDETFDYISCEAVLHHTPDPESTLTHLTEKLRPGGTMTLYVYKEKPRLRELADTVIRETTTEMTIEECEAFSEKMTTLGKELYETNAEITVPEIPELDIEAGTYSIHEFMYRYFLKCFFDWENEDWDTSVATNFDWYHPEYAYRYSESDFREMLVANDLHIEFFNEQMSGYSARVTK